MNLALQSWDKESGTWTVVESVPETHRAYSALSQRLQQLPVGSRMVQTYEDGLVVQVFAVRMARKCPCCGGVS